MAQCAAACLGDGPSGGCDLRFARRIGRAVVRDGEKVSVEGGDATHGDPRGGVGGVGGGGPRGGRVPRAVLLSVALALCFSAATAAFAAEIEFADGRRETVADPKQDSKGQWLATRDGRRTVLKPGDVVAIVDDAGKETVTIPALAEAPDTPEVTAALATVKTGADGAWEAALDVLAKRPTQAVIDALVALAGDAKKDLRGRAYRALCALKTRESVAAAGAAILREKDDATRRASTSLLFAVQGIFERSDTLETVKAGIADRDAGVRVAFAMLSPPDMEAANAVLRTDGIKHPDHHVRESSAMELGKRGDAAGESILAGMLGRTSLPGAEKGEAIYERLLIEEQVAVCRIFGKLKTEKGRAALMKATKSKHEAVRKAAEAALAE